MKPRCCCCCWRCRRLLASRPSRRHLLRLDLPRNLDFRANKTRLIDSFHQPPRETGWKLASKWPDDHFPLRLVFRSDKNFNFELKLNHLAVLSSRRERYKFPRIRGENLFRLIRRPRGLNKPSGLLATTRRVCPAYLHPEICLVS